MIVGSISLMSMVRCWLSDGTIYMFDCGEGVQRQLHRTPFRHRTIDNIFITHMHGDHVSISVIHKFVRSCLRCTACENFSC